MYCGEDYLDLKMVRPTGLEPVTLGLEGRCSIQMSYGRNVFFVEEITRCLQEVVGVERFELPTLWSQTRCATRLRYTPTFRRADVPEEGEIIRRCVY